MDDDDDDDVEVEVEVEDGNFQTYPNNMLATFYNEYVCVPTCEKISPLYSHYG